MSSCCTSTVCKSEIVTPLKMAKKFKVQWIFWYLFFKYDQLALLDHFHQKTFCQSQHLDTKQYVDDQTLSAHQLYIMIGNEPLEN